MRAGDRLGPYQIVAPLGAGGMGEVYRARDTRLGRDVAIKVLRAEVAGDPERVRRFEKEARTVASLSHPNILALYDVGSHEGQPYLVTELLEGQTLAERIRSGDLTVAKAVELGTQIAHGLAAAHEHGIVHRDLKPGNVFVTKDGVVKILDFGLARLTHVESGEWDPTTASTESWSTGAKTILGTVGYMAPEQIRLQAVDHRADIFAFGCVLYEMLSGRRAFVGETPADTMSAILSRDPRPLLGAVEQLPPALDPIVRRCLEKHPEDRFQSARDLAHDLDAILINTKAVRHAAAPAATKRWRTIALGVAAVAVLAVAGSLVLRLAAPRRAARDAKPPKIVVLPFENLGAPEDAYFASGMAEEITSRLANVQGLGVISRTTAVEYDRKGKTVKQIGADLGVDYVLEGSVRFEHGQGKESQVRITPQLIRVADDTHVWASRYDRVLADVFAMQSEVAENAVRAMGVAVFPRERAALKDVSTSDIEAYDLFLRGQELFGAGEDRKHVEGALQMYEAAVDRDPRFVQALAGLARSHLFIYWNYTDRSHERLTKAKEAAERAVELRPDLAETHTALGYYFYRSSLDYARALREFASALSIQPNSSAAHEGIGYVLRRQGRWRESTEEIRKALEFDPKNAVLVANLGRSCVLDRRYADASHAFELAVALSPRWGDAWAWRAWLQIQWLGNAAKAHGILQEAEGVVGLAKDSLNFGPQVLRVALVRRDYRGALRLLEAQALPAYGNQMSYRPISLLRGEVHALAGQSESARRYFEAARLELEERVTHDPEDDRYHGVLGIACAGVGRRAEAVREAKLGCELMPTTKDAWRALWRLEDLAVVYTMAGRHAEAISALDDLLGRSGEWTPHVLRLDPRWDPLRSDPRFQALLTKYAVKE